MTDSKFRPGMLVRDNNHRVGRIVGAPTVIELDGNPVEVYPVDFWGSEVKRPDNWLTPLAPDCPESLLVERPEALASWADEAPLKLVALALSVDGGSGKVADIRAKLAGRVIGEGRWENWWKKQPQRMRKMPVHFRVSKVGKDNEYNLVSSFESVTVVQDSEASQSVERNTARASDWKSWLEAESREVAPGRFPPRQVVGSLALWPAGNVESVLFRLIVAAEELVAARETSPQVAEGWLRAVAQAALRWRESGGSDPRGYTAARVGEVLARLAGIAGERTPQELLLQAGALDGVTDAWRRGFLAGLWESFEGEDARNMYLGSSAVLGRQARGDLAREMFLAAFGPDFSERRHAELDRLIDALPESDRVSLLEEVMARASSAQKAEVRDYLAESRHARGDPQLPLRIAAALLLSDGSGEFVSQTSRELADVIENPQRYGKTLEGVFSAAASKNVEVKFTATAEVQKRSAEARAEIDAERAEQERLKQQVRERNAELAANREESRLELRQDMLLVMGELLQATSGWNSLDDAVRDVEAGIALALGAGGAELLENPGQWVEYDVRLHKAEEQVHTGARVRVVAPGVIYRSGIHGDRVLLKAQVKHEAG